MDTDPPENPLKFKYPSGMFLNSALIIGLRNHIENNIKTGQ